MSEPAPPAPPPDDDPTAVGEPPGPGCPTCGRAESTVCPDPFHSRPRAAAPPSASAEYRRRVTPTGRRPLLTPEGERTLGPINEASARLYDLQERAGEKAQRFAREIDDGAVQVHIEHSESLVFAIRPPPVPRPPEEPAETPDKEGPDGQE